jgi:hypothetical protein
MTCSLKHIITTTTLVVVSRRYVTLTHVDELLDALTGMMELFGQFSQLATARLGDTLRRLLEMLTDEEDGVRKGVHAVLQLMFASIDERAFAPFVSLVVAHLSSALTHLSSRIRIESLSVLDALVRAHPRQMAKETHWANVLPCFDDLLSLAMTGGSSARSKMRTLVLNSMRLLLDTAEVVGATSARSRTASVVDVDNNDDDNNDSDDVVVQRVSSSRTTAQPLSLAASVDVVPTQSDLSGARVQVSAATVCVSMTHAYVLVITCGVGVGASLSARSAALLARVRTGTVTAIAGMSACMCVMSVCMHVM